MIKSYRVTVAFSREEIETFVLQSPATDLMGVTEEAFEFIEMEYGSTALMKMIAFSVLRQEPKDEQSDKPGVQ